MQLERKPLAAATAVPTIFAIVVVRALAVSLATTPVALASSSGASLSDYPIEIMRAHTVYKMADPTTPVVIGLGVHGNL